MSQRSILVVDDEVTTLEMCRDVLTEYGYEIVAVQSGEEALKTLEQKSFQMILTDIQLPGVDGLGLLRECRKRFPLTEVILMTAYGKLSSAVDALRQGAYDYITKPFSSETLLNSIRKCFEIIELQKKLKSSQDRMIEHERLATLGSVSSWLAHRMRNHLSVIKMCTRYLQDKLARDKDQKTDSNSERLEPGEIYNAILEKINSLEKMTSDFIAYSKIYELQKNPENLNELLETSITSLSARIQIQKIKCQKQLAAHLPAVSCDRHILVEVFENIILNALEAIGPQENETLAIKSEVVKSEDSNDVAITISNTGSSVPEEVKEQIFTPFFTTKTNGSGLGLSIAKKVVERHGGHIVLESEDSDTNKKTTVRMIFPVNGGEKSGELLSLETS